MGFQQFITEKVKVLQETINAVILNAKKIDELPNQTILNPASKIHVSRGGISESLEVQKIIDAVSSSSYNQLLSIGEIALDENVTTIPANAQWKIDEVYYSNTSEIEIIVPYCSTGLERKDILVADTSNNIVLVQGTETAGITIRPNIPINTVFVTEMDVTDSSVSNPTPPIVGSDYVEKVESSEVVLTEGDIYIQFSLPGYSSIRFTGTTTQVGGVYIFPEYKAYSGKKLRLKNFQATNILLKHLGPDDPDINVKFWFPTETDLVFKPGQVIEFAYSFVSGNFEFIGSATDLTNYYTKTEVDTADSTTLASAQSYTDNQVSNLINGELTYDTLKKLADELRAQRSIIGGTTPDGDSVVNTVTELLAVMATFPEGVDMLTLIGSKVNTSDVYNALDCVVSGKVADARTVKTLNDLISALATTVAGKEDTSNKTDDETTSTTSSIKYFSVKGFWLAILNKLFPNTPVKATALVDADLILTGDSEDGFKTKTRTFAQLLATLGTRLLTYFQAKDNQVEVSANSNVLNTWDGQTVLFTANCTITVPSTLNNSLMFPFRTLAGVTVTWAITSPFTWETTPSTTPEKTVGHFIRRGSTNTVILDM